MTKIDGIEDRLMTTEQRGANDISNSNAAWQRKRNRDRLAEIIKYVEAAMKEADKLEAKYEP